MAYLTDAGHKAGPIVFAPPPTWLQRCKSARTYGLAAYMSLFFLFAYDTYSYSVGDAFFVVHWEEQHIATGKVAAAISAYSTTSLAGLCALLLVMAFAPRYVASSPASLPWQLLVSLLALALSWLGAWAMVAAPYSFPVFVAARTVQGAAAAVYFLQMLVMVSVAFPASKQIRAIAMLNSGLCMGDSMGPLLGGLLYSAAGIRAGVASMAAAGAPALLCLLLFMLWAVRVPRRATLDQLEAAGSLQPAPGSGKDVFHKVAPACPAGGADLAATPFALAAPARGAWPAPSPSPPNSQPLPLPLAGSSLLLPQPFLAAAMAGKDAAGAAAAPDARDAAAGGAPDQRLPSADASMILGFASYAPAAAGADGPPPFTGRMVWGQLRDSYVVLQCGVVFLSQAARQLVVLLLPLVMRGSPMWVVSLVYGAETLGAIAAPFLLEGYLSRHPPKSAAASHAILLCCALLKGGVTMACLWTTKQLYLLFPLMVLAGAAHSTTETMVYVHVSGHVGSGKSSDGSNTTAATSVSMCVFAVLYTSGFMVGSYLLGACKSDDVPGQRIVATCLGASIVAYTLALVFAVLTGRLASNEWSYVALPTEEQEFVAAEAGSVLPQPSPLSGASSAPSRVGSAAPAAGARLAPAASAPAAVARRRAALPHPLVSHRASGRSLRPVTSIRFFEPLGLADFTVAVTPALAAAATLHAAATLPPGVLQGAGTLPIAPPMHKQGALRGASSVQAPHL